MDSRGERVAALAIWAALFLAARPQNGVWPVPVAKHTEGWITNELPAAEAVRNEVHEGDGSVMPVRAHSDDEERGVGCGSRRAYLPQPIHHLADEGQRHPVLISEHRSPSVMGSDVSKITAHVEIRTVEPENTRLRHSVTMETFNEADGIDASMHMSGGNSSVLVEQQHRICG